MALGGAVGVAGVVGAEALAGEGGLDGGVRGRRPGVSALVLPLVV